MSPIRFLRSPHDSVRQKIAISSEATTMSKPSSRGKPLAWPPSATVIWRSARSFMSTTRFQRDAADVDVEGVAVVHVVVDQRGEQVVRGGDGREVAGEVQVDVGHRHDLAVAAAGSAALHAEDRAHRRLAQAGHRALAQPVQRVGETHGGRGLALTGRRRRQRGHQDQASEGPVLQRSQVADVDLRLVVAVRDEVLLVDPEGLGGHLPDRPQRRGVRDLDVRQQAGRPPLCVARHVPRAHVSRSAAN